MLGHNVKDDGDHGSVQLVLHNCLLLEAGQPAQEGHRFLPAEQNKRIRVACQQCCGTITIFYGSGSDFRKFTVPVSTFD